MPPLKNLNIAVDIGGTFTDLLAFDTDTGRIHQAKCLSTPPEFAKGVLDGIRKAELDLTAVESFVHGSTVAINTALERTGAKTALIVTRGTRDVYQIGRGNRPESYNILFQRPEPLALIVSFYGFVEAFARRLGLNPDEPRNLRKVTETR